MYPFIIFGGFLLIIIKSWQWCFKRPLGCPPGPPRMPVLGSYLQLLFTNYKHLHKAALKLSERYKSKVISFYLGSVLVYAVHDPNGIKEVLSSASFEGRPGLFLSLMRHPEMKTAGIFFNDGHVWREQRWFFLRYLRDFGYGRRFQTFEQVISEEVQDLVNLLREGPKYSHEKRVVKGNRFLAPTVFMPFSTNTFFEVLFKERYPRSEHYKLDTLSESGALFARETSEYGRLLSMIPWIRFFFPKWSGYNSLMNANIPQYNFFKRKVEYYIKNFTNFDEEDPSFMDLYIRELKKDKIQDGFEIDQFIFNCMDFTLPANTGFPAQMSMILQWLQIRPMVVRKIQEEIDSVVGNSRLPSLDDRKKMPYTEACLREGMRIATLLPSSVVHLATEDTTILGYNVPKNTPIIGSLHALHFSKDIWDDPKEFRPERFLDSEGNLCLSKDKSLPFGAGKRLCPGETFARNLMFLMITGLLQNINLEVREGDTICNPLDNFTGIITIPDDFWISYTCRN